MDNFLDRLTLEGAEGQTDHTMSTFRTPGKVWGITVQSSYWEGRWPDLKFVKKFTQPEFGAKNITH